ncbi:MAG: hypothetical protein ACR5K4_02575 [Sodalis sp. (in: enterobacteria)]
MAGSESASANLRYHHYGIISNVDMLMFLGLISLSPQRQGGLKDSNIFAFAVEGKIKSSLDMLLNNFLADIISVFLAILYLPLLHDYYTPLVKILLKRGESWGSFFIKPAKILFLNNATNHGVFLPSSILVSLPRLLTQYFSLFKATSGRYEYFDDVYHI